MSGMNKTIDLTLNTYLKQRFSSLVLSFFSSEMTPPSYLIFNNYLPDFHTLYGGLQTGGHATVPAETPLT
jgi:hypothetical protein